MKLELNRDLREKLELITETLKTTSHDFIKELIEREVNLSLSRKDAKFMKYCSAGYVRGLIVFDEVIKMAEGSFTCYINGEQVGRMEPTQHRTHRTLLFDWYPAGHVVPEDGKYSPTE